MKRSLSLLLLCLLTLNGLLTAQNRRSPDACPGLNNKKATGQYTSLSKRSGQNSSFSSPRYQYLYAKDRYPVTASAEKRSSNTSAGTRSKGKTSTEAPAAGPSEKNPSSRSLREEKAEQKGKSPSSQELKNEDEFSNDHPEMQAPAENTASAEVSQKGESGAEPVISKEERTPSASKQKSNVEKTESRNPYTRNMVNTATESKDAKSRKKTSKKKKKHSGKGADSCPEF